MFVGKQFGLMLANVYLGCYGVSFAKHLVKSVDIRWYLVILETIQLGRVSPLLDISYISAWISNMCCVITLMWTIKHEGPPRKAVLHWKLNIYFWPHITLGVAIGDFWFQFNFRLIIDQLLLDDRLIDWFLVDSCVSIWLSVICCYFPWFSETHSFLQKRSQNWVVSLSFPHKIN